MLATSSTIGTKPKWSLLTATSWSYTFLAGPKNGMRQLTVSSTESNPWAACKHRLRRRAKCPRERQLDTHTTKRQEPEPHIPAEHRRGACSPRGRPGQPLQRGTNSGCGGRHLRLRLHWRLRHGVVAGAHRASANREARNRRHSQ
jgi:hypothetical protein